MYYNIEELKEIIKDFVTVVQKNSVTLADGKKDTVHVNKSIFDIESYLVQLRMEHDLNDRLDTSIVSENILRNFYSIAAKDAFNPADYQLNFLHHLAVNHLPDKELFELIDEFIDKYKDQFTLADIVITKSGATRCKTNMRFAVNDLRDLGLVLSRGADNKRSWEPSIMGLMILLNIQLNIAEFKKSSYFKYFKPFNSLQCSDTIKKVGNMFLYDPTLLDSLHMFENSTYIYKFLGDLSYETIDEDATLFKKLIELYIDYVHESLIITPKGVKVTKAFEEKSKIFQSALFQLEDKYHILHSKLYKHFRQEKI